MTIAERKQAAARAAVEAVPEGATVGLGSGSTAAYAIDLLGDHDIRGVPTSFQARERALDARIPVRSLDQVDGIDIAIDGADQVGPQALIKGGGAAHAREKVIDTIADQLAIVVDPRKLTDTLDQPVPLEVLPAARTVVAETVADLGGEPTLRRASEKSGPVVTDNGNLLLDCDFGHIDAPEYLARQLADLPGVLEHGLFVGVADTVYIGRDDGVETQSR